MNRNMKLRCICEGAVFIAAAMVLSYLKIPIGFSLGGFGGSIDFVMIPLVFFAVRWGLGWGLGAGLIYGTLKFYFAGGSALNWQSMLLDYSLAYMMVGLAGIFKRQPLGLIIGGFIGCLGRFAIHFISGITIYAKYMPDEFMDMTMTSPWFYSLLYNGTYMIPNTIIALIVGTALTVTLKKFILGEDLRIKE